jgi:hypothetical protein
MRASSFLFLLLLLLPACATAASEDRRAYILAHPHGWIEVTIADAFIPDIPPGEDSDEAWHAPFSCAVRVWVNDEPFLYDQAYPIGDAAPYRAETGFRFPASVGAVELGFSYQGCRVRENEVVAINANTLILVEEGKTHEVIFNGATLEVRTPRPSSVLTLEDVYEAITGRRSPVK